MDLKLLAEQLKQRNEAVKRLNDSKKNLGSNWTKKAFNEYREAQIVYRDIADSINTFENWLYCAMLLKMKKQQSKILYSNHEYMLTVSFNKFGIPSFSLDEMQPMSEETIEFLKNFKPIR